MQNILNRRWAVLQISLAVFTKQVEKITHNKPTRRYKVYAQSSTKADPESANPNNNYALIFLSRLKQPNNKYHERFLNLSKGTKITIQAVVSNKKANLVTQNSVKRASLQKSGFSISISLAIIFYTSQFYLGRLFNSSKLLNS